MFPQSDNFECLLGSLNFFAMKPNSSTEAHKTTNQSVVKLQCRNKINPTFHQ